MFGVHLFRVPAVHDNNNTVFQDEILAVGGTNHSKAEFYDIKSKKWTEVGDYPLSVWPSNCMVGYIRP